MEQVVLQYLIQYGLAGIVIFLFYTLLRNGLKELQKEMYELITEIRALKRAIYKQIRQSTKR